MAFKKLFFGKKREENDGQDEFFRDDFEPVFYPSPKKKSKADTAKPETKKDKAVAVKTEESKNSKTKSAKETNKNDVSVSKSEVKKSTPSVKKAAENAQPSPKKAASAKKTENKPAATKSEKTSEKTARKAAEGTVKTATQKKTKTTPPPTVKASAKSKKAVNDGDLADDSPIVKDAVAVSEGNETANGKWEIRRAKDGRYFFALYASNHTVIAYSQIYSSTTAVNTGINSVIANAQKCEIEDTTLKKTISIPCPKWEIYFDKADQYRFRLYAPNGLCICHSSHGYASKSGCKGGIESIKRFSTEAKVDKSYKK